MPFSWDHANGHVSAIIRQLRPQSVCDIGAGAGKYARLVRNLSAEGMFKTRITGIEIDQSYVDRFQLKELYDELVIADAMTLLSELSRRFDLVIIGDCLEHMRHSDGLDLIHYLLYRAGYILIVYPHELQQDDWQGHIHEAHISTWSENDFRGMRCVSLRCDALWVYLIKGYHSSPVEIISLNPDHIVTKIPIMNP